MHASIIEINHMEQAYDEVPIFKDASMAIMSHDRIGLVGNNGTGKTTLVKMIMGEVAADAGQVRVDPDCRIGYLRQVNEQTVDGQVAYETLSRMGVAAYKDMDRERLESLSGGERTKFQLGALFDQFYDMIILDEPTNHLDYAGRQWLIGKLKAFEGALLVISHDRYFLDEVADAIIEIDKHTLFRYAGNYSAYVAQKAHARHTQVQAYEKQEKEKAQIQREIHRLKQWSDKGHRESTTRHLKKGTTKFGAKEFQRAKAKKKDKQVKSKIKQLEKIDLDGVERPDCLLEIRFRFSDGAHKSKKVLSVEGVSKSFGGRVLFEGAYFYLFRGQRVGLVGPNGSGKSTLIRMIRGLDEDYAGRIYLNTGQSIAYVSQDILDMETDKTVLEVMDLFDRERQGRGRQILAQMGIGADKAVKRIGQLSMGERTRVKIARLILDEVDFLILDEPTNHLDLATKATLQEALGHFYGTILLCSHDRYLVESVCESLLVIEDQGIHFFNGAPRNYYEKGLGKDVGGERADQENARLRLMVLETQASEVLGRLSSYAPESKPYMEASLEYQDVLDRIHQIKSENP